MFATINLSWNSEYGLYVWTGILVAVILGIAFPLTIPDNFSEEEILSLLQSQGYTRIHSRIKSRLEVVQDRLRVASAERARVIQALEAARSLDASLIRLTNILL